MKRLILICILPIILFLSVGNVIFHHNLQVPARTSDQQTVVPNPLYTILLLPLDNRPPCLQFPQQLAPIAGAKVIVPPLELLGHNHTPGERQQLANWVITHAAQADALILSADMSIHGGLIPSRLPYGTQQDYEYTLQLIRQLHHCYPDKPLIVFSIIPRLIVADEVAKHPNDQSLMLQYSFLREQQEVFYDLTSTEIGHYLNRFIPSTLRDRYEHLYQQNTDFSLALIDLVRQQMVTEILLGQDDTVGFGLSHMEKSFLSSYLSAHQELADKVWLIRGTDEIAACLTTRILLHKESKKPTIYVQYNHPETMDLVMPYMPCSVDQVVQEKIKLVCGEQMMNREQADLVLYIHVGTATTTPQQIQAEAEEIQQLLQQPSPVALVDLSQDFKSSQCLFPYLMQKNIDISRLASYSGWNTTSNAVGTALAQSCLTTAFLYSGMLDHQHALQSLQSHHSFLIDRMLDDWYFEKILQPDLNQQLTRKKINPRNIGNTNVAINQQLTTQIDHYGQFLFQRYWVNVPLLLPTCNGTSTVYATKLVTTARLPWDRTFEVEITPRISIK